jgi:hypothetical protein
MSVLFGPVTYFDDPGLADGITADAIRLDEEGSIVCVRELLWWSHYRWGMVQ